MDHLQEYFRLLYQQYLNQRQQLLYKYHHRYEQKAQLMKRIEQITGKATETLVLKNGTRVEGVIIQEGDTYHVLTTEGKKSFTESQVEGTEF